MPIFFPPAVGGASVNLMRPLFNPNLSVGLVPCTDAFFSPLIGQYVFVIGSGIGFLHAAQPGNLLQYSNSGIAASGATCRGVEFDGRLYRVRLGNTVATAVRSTADLATWQTDFGGIIINGVDANADKLILATNYSAGGPNNGVIYTGTTWDNIYSGNPVNALSCFITSTGRILFGFAGGIIRYSDNNGGTWTEVNLGIAEEVEKFAEDDNNRLYAALDTGYIFESTDDGATWANGGIRQTGGIDTFFFSGVAASEMTVYGVGGTIFRRTAEFVWSAVPTPTDQNFSGSMRGDFVGGLSAPGYLVSEQ